MTKQFHQKKAPTNLIAQSHPSHQRLACGGTPLRRDLIFCQLTNAREKDLLYHVAEARRGCVSLFGSKSYSRALSLDPRHRQFAKERRVDELYVDYLVKDLGKLHDFSLAEPHGDIALCTR
jgi:hypothetical protein